MKHLFCLLFIFFVTPGLRAQVYLPNHLSPNQKKTQLTKVYIDWKKKYLKSSNGATPGGGYYIEMFGPNGTGYANHKTTSEAMGYGMLITILAHKIDPQAQVVFNGLFNMYRQHRSIHTPHLMSWMVHKTEQKKYDSASATDGDFDIALALLLAHQIWGSTTRHPYRSQALSLINSIVRKEINSNNHKIMLGDWWHSQWSEISRSSDWMGGHLLRFHRETQNPLFLKVRTKVYDLAEHLQRSHSPQTGLLPDFISTAQHRPAPPHVLEGPYDGDYYYNAARVPLRFVLDYRQQPDNRIKNILQKMMKFFYQKSQGSPQRIKGGYKLNGTVIGDYFDTSFVAPVIAAATVDSRYQKFVNQGWDLLIKQRMNYFADSITLLSLFYLADQWVQ